MGKAREVPMGHPQGDRAAKKNLIHLTWKGTTRIPQSGIGALYGSAASAAEPRPNGTGIIAGGPVRPPSWKWRVKFQRC